MEGLLGYLHEGFVQYWQAAALTAAPFSIQLALAVLAYLVTRIFANRAQASVGKAMTITKADVHVVLLVGRSTYYFVWSIGVLVILGVFGVGWTAMAAALGVVGLAITVSLQDVLKNFVAGAYLLLERPFRIGDRVRVKDFSGTVEDVRLRTTCLRTEEGSQVIIPNATIFVEVVVNSGALMSKEKVEQKRSPISPGVREGYKAPPTSRDM